MLKIITNKNLVIKKKIKENRKDRENLLLFLLYSTTKRREANVVALANICMVATEEKNFYLSHLLVR